MATVLPQSNESFLPWLSFILGSVDKTVDRNREAKDRALLSQWVQQGSQGQMPSLTSDWGKNENDRWFAQQMENTRLNRDLSALNTWQTGRENFMQNPYKGGSAVPGMMGLPVPIPNMQAFQAAQTMPTMESQPGARMAFNLMDPRQQAEIQNLNAQTGLYEAQAGAAGQKTWQPQDYVNPKTGETRWVIPGNPAPPGFIAREALANMQLVGRTDPVTKQTEQKYILKGSDIEPGWEVVSPAGTSLTVNMPSAGERKDLAEGQSSLDILDNLKNLYLGVKSGTNPITMYPGPVMGPGKRAVGKYGLTGTNTENFIAATDAMKNKIIQMVTGANMGAQEARRILGQVPLDTDPGTRWEAKWNQTRYNLQILQSRYEEAMRKSGLTPIAFEKYVQDKISNNPDPWVQEFQQSSAGGVPTISGDDEFDKLPSGVEFIGPDGVKRRKP